jgi:hypothetical protein
MEALLTPLRLQKAGNAEEEYEDAYYPAGPGRREGAELRFAVADGASEGMLSGAWARLLVKLHGRYDWTHGSVEQFLERAYRDWNLFRAEYLGSRERRNRPVQWYEEPGLQAGAFSTLLGLTLTGSAHNGTGAWSAFAVGDSCLFQVRGGALVTKFPLEQSSEFNNRPVLLASNPVRNAQTISAIKQISGKFQSGDVFYLMTDALARWCFQEHEEGRNRWLLLRDLGTTEALAFDVWIDGLRKTQEIRNDDVTLIRIDLPRTPSMRPQPGEPLKEQCDPDRSSATSTSTR